MAHSSSSRPFSLGVRAPEPHSLNHPRAPRWRGGDGSRAEASQFLRVSSSFSTLISFDSPVWNSLPAWPYCVLSLYKVVKYFLGLLSKEMS